MNAVLTSTASTHRPVLRPRGSTFVGSAVRPALHGAIRASATRERRRRAVSHRRPSRPRNPPLAPRHHGRHDARRRFDRDRDHFGRRPRERPPTPAIRGAFHRSTSLRRRAPFREPHSGDGSFTRLCHRDPAPTDTFRNAVAHAREPSCTQADMSALLRDVTASIDFCHETGRGHTLRTPGSSSPDARCTPCPPARRFRRSRLGAARSLLSKRRAGRWLRVEDAS